MGRVSWNPAYNNGEIPASALASYYGQGLLHASACEALRQFNAAFNQRFPGESIIISEGYRDLAGQIYWRNWWSAKGQPNKAAIPGTSSHGEAVAIDIDSDVYGGSAGTVRHNWLVQNAPRFGWSWELIGRPSGEPWHFNYVGPLNNYNPPIQEDDMYDEANRKELIGDRIDGTIVPDLRTIKANQTAQAKQLDAAIEQLKNVIRREARYRLYRRTSNGGICAVNWPSGHVIRYDSMNELLWDMKMQIIALIIDGQGARPENAIECSDKDFDKVLARAAAIHDSPNGVSQNGQPWLPPKPVVVKPLTEEK